MLEEKDHNALWMSLGFKEKPKFDSKKVIPAAKVYSQNWEKKAGELFYPGLAKWFEEKKKKWNTSSDAFYYLDEAVLKTMAGEDFYHLKLMMLAISTWWHGEDIVPGKPLEPHSIAWLAGLADEDHAALAKWYSGVCKS